MTNQISSRLDFSIHVNRQTLPEHPKTIDWFVTSICNLHCGFCYGPEPEKDENPNSAFAIIDKILESNSPNVTLCGGEPFIHPKIVEIILALKSGGKNIYVSTNGMFLNKYKKILSHLTMVSISIDGHNEDVYQGMRGKEASFKKVLSSIDYIKENAPEKLKLTTIVSKLNINQIRDIGKFVSDIHPAVWRVFQFVPRNRGFVNSSKYEITDNQFESVRTDLHSLFPDLPIFCSNITENSSCFILSHHGDIMLPSGAGYIVLGNCFSESIDSCWREKWIRKSLHIVNKSWM